MKVVFQFLIAFAFGIATGFAAITVPPAPGNGEQPLVDSITAMAQHDPKFFNGSPPLDLAVQSPHRVYTLGLTNLAAGQLLSAAVPGSWRYLVDNGTNIVGEAMASIVDDGKLKLISISSTRFARETRIAIQRAEADQRFLNHDYELRYLLVPSIHFTALWLHAETDDVIIPLLPTWNRMKNDPFYSENEVLQLLRPEAQRTLRMLAEDGGPVDRNANAAMMLHAFNQPAEPVSLPATDDHPSGILVGFGVRF